MARRATPAIACIGVIGRHDNPLHISIFDSPEGPRDELEYEFLLSSCLDIFEARLPTKTADHDFGLLQAVDERLAMYGWLTNTSVKLVVMVDMEGRSPMQQPANQDPGAGTARSSWGAGLGGASVSAVTGIRDQDLKPAFRALHLAYMRLLRNPFFDPDDLDPRKFREKQNQGIGGPTTITSPRFLREVQRIGETWHPGIQSI